MEFPGFGGQLAFGAEADDLPWDVLVGMNWVRLAQALAIPILIAIPVVTLC